jgi:hypothetical protein
MPGRVDAVAPGPQVNCLPERLCARDLLSFAAFAALGEQQIPCSAFAA